MFETSSYLFPPVLSIYLLLLHKSLGLFVLFVIFCFVSYIWDRIKPSLDSFCVLFELQKSYNLFQNFNVFSNIYDVTK